VVGFGFVVAAVVFVLVHESPAEKWLKAFSQRLNVAIEGLEPERQLDVVSRLVNDSGPFGTVARATLARLAQGDDELSKEARIVLQSQPRRAAVTNPAGVMCQMLERFTARKDSIDDIIYSRSIDAAMELLFDEDPDVRLVAREVFGPLGVFRECAA
jgi:hypothetical protein